MSYTGFQPGQVGGQQAFGQHVGQLGQQFPLLHQLVTNAVQQALAMQGQQGQVGQQPWMQQGQMGQQPWMQQGQFGQQQPGQQIAQQYPMLQQLVSNAIHQALSQQGQQFGQPGQIGQYPLLHQLVSNAIHQALSQQGQQFGQLGQIGQQQPIMMGAY